MRYVLLFVFIVGCRVGDINVYNNSLIHLGPGQDRGVLTTEKQTVLVTNSVIFINGFEPLVFDESYCDSEACSWISWKGDKKAHLYYKKRLFAVDSVFRCENGRQDSERIFYFSVYGVDTNYNFIQQNNER